jgi:hypothetical protein
MSDFAEDGLLWLVASPIAAGAALLRHVKFWRTAYALQAPCGTCGAAISLVGLWRCRCGYTYRGHVLRECPVCHSLPRMVRCFACGLTQTLPQV